MSRTAAAPWSFKALMEAFFSRAFSDDMKRLIFLSSLTAYLDNITNPNNTLVNNLNELFSLSKHPNSFKLPMQLNSKIWGTLDQTDFTHSGVECESLRDLRKQRLTIPQLRIVSRRIINRMPKWLMYSSKENMKKDIFKLMLNAEKLRAN